jgi:hypothetical protein
MFVCAALCVCCPINTTENQPLKSQESLVPKSVIPTVSLAEPVRVATASDQPLQLASTLLFERATWSNSGFGDPIPQSNFGDPDITGSIAEIEDTADEKPVRVFSKEELCNTAMSVAEENNLPVLFFANLIQQESAFRPHVVSPAGAQGIAQFMPQVAEAYGLADPFDPIDSLHASGRFLSELRAQFGNLGLAAAAYNAGSRRVQNWLARRGKLPAETRQYVRNITGRPAEHWVRNRNLVAHADIPLYARCSALRAFAKAAVTGAHAVSHARQRLAFKLKSVRRHAAASPKRARLAAR